MQLNVVKLSGCFLSILMGCCTPAPAQLRFTAFHSIPAWDQDGALVFEIDPAYNKGPYSVLLEGPCGTVDSIAAFNGTIKAYEGIGTGQYCITVKCCSTCTARVCVEVKPYELVSSGDATILWTRENALPENDTTAVLLACTEMEAEQGVLCSAVFSLYAPVDIPSSRLQLMLEKAVQRITPANPEAVTEDQGYNYDAWVSDPFEVLLRFDETGQILWVYINE